MESGICSIRPGPLEVSGLIDENWRGHIRDVGRDDVVGGSEKVGADRGPYVECRPGGRGEADGWRFREAGK